MWIFEEKSIGVGLLENNSLKHVSSIQHGISVKEEVGVEVWCWSEQP